MALIDSEDIIDCDWLSVFIDTLKNVRDNKRPCETALIQNNRNTFFIDRSQ